MKPIKGKFGYLQGICNRCGEDDLPLIRRDGEVVCDTCSNLLDRVKLSVKTREQVDADDEFLDRAING